MAPVVSAAAYLFGAASLIRVAPSTGMGISTALSVLLLVAAAVFARPDRNPLRWLLHRPDRWSLARMIGVLAGMPVIIGLSRLALLHLGVADRPSWVLSITVSTIGVGAATFYLSQREQILLIDREQLSRKQAATERARAGAEARYRILAENAVDVVLHLRGSEIVWISPSVSNGFGEPPQHWIGTDFFSHIHPDDIQNVRAALQEIIHNDGVVMVRFRFKTADGGYHWVDGRGKPYVDADGNTDGATGSMRIVDDQVQAERKLEHQARFDELTGLTNRPETISRLMSALERPRSPSRSVGLLFCDIDNFKAINDTWGHAAGDAVLATMAERIRDCVRAGDTVGRMGGDEMVVLLTGLHDIDEGTRIAEQIRLHAAEPIHHSGRVIRATLSIGVTLATAGESADTITARADAAMYDAKKAGRNAVRRI